jgi:hypothetical protein
MAQPVGLVVEPVVLNRLGIFPESATAVLADWQQRLPPLSEKKSARSDPSTRGQTDDHETAL